MDGVSPDPRSGGRAREAPGGGRRDDEAGGKARVADQDGMAQVATQQHDLSTAWVRATITFPYGATTRPRLVERIAEARSVAGRGCSPSPQARPDALHVLVLTVAGWVNRPPEDQLAYLPRRATEPPGLLAWRLGRARRVPVVGRVGSPRRRVCHDRWSARTCWPGREPRRTAGRCPATAAPGPRQQARGAVVGPRMVQQSGRGSFGCWPVGRSWPVSRAPPRRRCQAAGVPPRSRIGR